MRIFHRPVVVQSIFRRSLRGHMSIPKFLPAILLCLILSGALFAQSGNDHAALLSSGGASPADNAKASKLEHFDPEMVDKTLDPCNSFYKYACNKWLTANPIPPDQAYTRTRGGLEIS